MPSPTLNMQKTQNSTKFPPLKPLYLGNNPLMREVGQDISVAKQKVARLVGVPALIKMKGARGKVESAKGQVASTFPAVFTILFEDGTSKTFPYADVLTGNVLFLRPRS